MNILFQSFFVYFTTAAFLYMLGIVASKREIYQHKNGIKRTFWTWEIVTSLLLFAFISGVRWDVGVDHQHYLANYRIAQNKGTEISEYEPGFSILTSWMAAIGIHYIFYFALLAFLQIFFVYRTFKNERYLLPFIGLIVILGAQYLMWMNGIRQMLAATIFLYSLQFAAERKPIHYIAIILISSLFHKSSIILLPLYFIATKDFLPNRIAVLLVFSISLFIGSNPNWITSIQNQLTPILSLLNYANYSEILEVLIEKSDHRNLGPRRLAEILLFCFIVWHSPRLKKVFANTNFTTYCNVYIIGFIFHSLLINTHHVFLRPIFFLTICSIPSAAYLLVYLFRQSRRKMFRFVFVLALATSYTPLSFIADFDLNAKEYSNYKFFWDYDL